MPNSTNSKKSWWSQPIRSRQENDIAGEGRQYTLWLLMVGGVLAILLQTTLVHHLPLLPDLLLIFCVYLGMYHRSVTGAAGAFFLGYGLDSCSGAPVGMNAFAMSLVFAAVSATSRCLWLNNPFSVLCLVLLGVVLKTGAFLVLSDFGQLTVMFQPVVARYVVWDATIAMLLTPIVFSLLYRGEPFSYRV